MNEEKMTNEEAAQQSAELQQKEFDEKVKDFTAVMEGVAEQFGVKIVAAIHFTKEGASGAHAYGETNTLEELGLAATIKQRFNL